VIFAEWQSLVGSVLDISYIVHETGEAMYGLFWPHRRGHAPADEVHLEDFTVDKLQRWVGIIETCAGAPWSPRHWVGTPAHTPVEFSLYSDAAKADAPVPSIAG
jgi:hypothetical protein